MSIKYFCDECGKEVSLDEECAQEIDSGADWTQWQHEECVEIVKYDKTNDERNSFHTCTECDEKEVRYER